MLHVLFIRYESLDFVFCPKDRPIVAIIDCFKDRMVVCAGGNANGGQTCEMLPPHMKLWDDFPSLLTYRSWGPGMAAAPWGLVLAGSYYR